MGIFRTQIANMEMRLSERSVCKYTCT